MGVKAPAIGAAVATVFALAAAYFQWIDPGAMMHFGKVIALMFWLLGGVVAVAALVGFVEQKTSPRRRSDQLDSLRTIQDIHKLTPGAFEQTVADIFRRQGYRVEETGRTGDGGVDLILRRNSDASTVHLVQCKRYKAWKVRAPEIREFFGAMAACRTRCEGIFVTCGRYTNEARAFAADKPIRLIDGDELLQILNATNPLTPAVETFTNPPPQTKAPLCPSCQRPMLRRTAQQGAHAGKSFWGCPNYPKCRQIIDG